MREMENSLKDGWIKTLCTLGESSFFTMLRKIEFLNMFLMNLSLFLKLSVFQRFIYWSVFPIQGLVFLDKTWRLLKLRWRKFPCASVVSSRHYGAGVEGVLRSPCWGPPWPCRYRVAIQLQPFRAVHRPRLDIFGS